MSNSRKKQLLSKLERYCAYQERSHLQVLNKCRELGITFVESNELLVELIERNFLNEARFVEIYVRSKLRQKGWGRQKIAMGLKQAGITAALIEKALKNVEDQWQDVIQKQMQKKLKQLTPDLETFEELLESIDKISFENRNKIYRYLLGKGFTPDQISKVLKVDL